MPGKLNISTTQTPEKFKHLAAEVTGFLIENLQLINELEQEIVARDEVLKTKRIGPNQLHPGEEGLWKEYRLRRGQITTPISLKPTKYASHSFGTPSEYAYLSSPATTMEFIMKTTNRAVVETAFETGVRKKHQFALKKVGDSWKIDTKKYCFEGEETWWRDQI